MIPDDKLQLLTAAVDGDLSPADALALQQLLGESSAARELFAALQGDRDRLRAIPAVVPPKDLPARILAALPVVTPRSASRPRRVERAHPWIAIAVAACVLFGVAASSYWFFTQQAEQAGKSPVGHNPATASTSGAGRSGSADVPPPDANRTAPPAVNEASKNLAHDHPQPPERADVIPEPRPVNRPLVGAPPGPEFAPFEMVQVRLPFLAAVADLERDDMKVRLAEELGRDAAVRIDLFAKDTGRGADAFLAAARAGGLTVLADANAGERVKRRTPGAYVVYVESLTAAEVRDLFVRLAAEEAKHSQKTFDSLHVTAAGPVEQKELKDGFGFDPGPWKRGLAGQPEPKAISSGTGEAVAKSVSGSGGRAEKFAALTVHGSTRTPPGMSRELKLFAEKRSDRRANTVPVIIMIRTAG